jgi:hypothetical protein
MDFEAKYFQRIIRFCRKGQQLWMGQNQHRSRWCAKISS